MLTQLSLPPVRPIGEALHRFTPDRVNERSGIQHTWMAAAEMWKEVIPSDLVDRLNVRYGHQLQQLGFVTGSGTDTDKDTARNRWRELYPERESVLPEDAYRAEVRVPSSFDGPVAIELLLFGEAPQPGNGEMAEPLSTSAHPARMLLVFDRRERGHGF